MEITSAMVMPSGDGIYEARGIDFPDVVGEYAVDTRVTDTVVAFPGLAPALVVNDLGILSTTQDTSLGDVNSPM